MENMIEILSHLSELNGVSGDESNVRDYIISKIKDHCTYSIDPMGNLIAFKQGGKKPAKKLMLSAHMDEVGFIITYIDDNGLASFAPVGGIDSRVVVGKSVTLNGHHGVIGTKAVHMQNADERDKPVKIDKLYIDIGADTKEEALKHFSVGDRAAWNSSFVEFGEDFIKGKALDDRAGCAMLINLIQSELPYDCYFAFTVNEETGVMGAQTAAYTVNPDIAIIVETTTAADIGGVSKANQVCRLGKGPVVSFMDRGTIYDTPLYKQVRGTAEQQGIPNQTKEGVFGGNESRAIQRIRGGVRVTGISLPCRYLHSPSCVLKKSDIENTEKLLRSLVGELTV